MALLVGRLTVGQQERNRPQHRPAGVVQGRDVLVDPVSQERDRILEDGSPTAAQFGKGVERLQARHAEDDLSLGIELDDGDMREV